MVSSDKVAPALESLKQNTFYKLHVALGISFDFPEYLGQELASREIPFPLRYEGMLPKVTPEEAERFSVLLVLAY